MPRPSVLALGYSEAAMLLRQPAAERVGAVLSVCGCGEFAVETSVPRRLVLRFDDVDAPDAADPLNAYFATIRRRWSAENGRPQAPPRREDARAVITFAESIRDLDGI